VQAHSSVSARRINLPCNKLCIRVDFPFYKVTSSEPKLYIK
jgi:hypothetical protein